MRSTLRVALALMMVLSVIGGAVFVAPTTTVEADAPESGAFVMLPVVQNGDGVTSLVAMQNTNAFNERFLITFYPSGKQFLTGVVPPKASFLVPNSVIPDGISSATVDTIAFIPTFTAVSPDFANLPIFWPPSIALTSFNNIGGSQGFVVPGGLDVAIRNGQINARDLCDTTFPLGATFVQFVNTYFPQFPCRNFFPGTAPANTFATGFVWSFLTDVTNVDYLYVTNATTGAVAGYFTETWSRLGDFLGVPGFDLLSPGAAVVVHRTDQTGPRVSEYEGVPFQRTSYSSTVPPGPSPLGTSSIAGAFPTAPPGQPTIFPSGQINPANTGFIGQFGFNVFAPLVMKNYHGWNTRIWFMNYNRNNQMVITYYDQAGNPVFEETGYALGTNRTTAVTGAGLPDGFVGTAWIATTRYNAVVVDEYRDNPPMLMSYRAEPSRVALALNTLSGITGNFNNFNPVYPTGTIANFSGTAAFSTAPLILSKYHGYNTGLAVLNPNAFEVRVILNFRRENGGEQYVISDRIPARGMTPFYDAAVANLPENFVGNVQIVAEYSPGVPAGIVAVVNQVNYIRGFASAYNAIDNVFDPAAENDLPFITKGFQGYNSGVAIMNLNPNPGIASGNFDVYTATGILERTVWQADSLHTATVYLPNMYQVPNGFVGGAAAYIVQTNQAPSPIFGAASPTYAVGAPQFTPLGQASVGGYQPTGAVTAVPATFPNPAQGTAIATVVNNVNYNGTGDTGATYSGFPVGGVFTGVGLGGLGAGGLTGLVKNCIVGVGIPGLPVFVFNASIVPPGISPFTWLNAQIPVNAPSTCQQAATVLPFNPLLQGAAGIQATGSVAQNGVSTINGTITAYVPATPAQAGVIQITTSSGQVFSFNIPAGTPISQFAIAPSTIGPLTTSNQQITVGLTGTFAITLAGGQAVALSSGQAFTGQGLVGSALPGGFTAALGANSFITFTDINGQWTLNGLPPGEYFVQVGGFSPACSPVGASGAGAPSQDATFSYVAFNNSEVDKYIVNGNSVTTADVTCLTPVGPVFEYGVVTGPTGAPVNGATIVAETICPAFNGIFPAGFGAPTSLGGGAAVVSGTQLANALAAYGIQQAPASGTTAAPALPGLLQKVPVQVPFGGPLAVSGSNLVGFGSAISGVGINLSASPGAGGITIPGAPTILPNQGAYVLALPFFGNYKKTVTAPGFNPQVYIVTDCAPVNRFDVQLGGATPPPSGTAPAAPVIQSGTSTPGSGTVVLSILINPPGSTVTATNVLVYEVVGGQNTLRTIIQNTGASNLVTATIGGLSIPSTRQFVAQALSVTGVASPVSSPPFTVTLQ